VQRSSHEAPGRRPEFGATWFLAAGLLASALLTFLLASLVG
jgi:hypothetical protein